MTEPTSKKLTRRDAIKILSAAAGASVLANLPSKWSTPELASGALPAHAQTSTLYSILCIADSTLYNVASGSFQMGVTITPNVAGIVVNYSLVSSIGVSITSLSTGTMITDFSGEASINVDAIISATPGFITATFTVGAASCTQVIDFQAITLPAVTTDSITPKASNLATFDGTVTSDGGASITDRGFVWSLLANPNPQIGGSGVHQDSLGAGGLGSFSSGLINTTFLGQPNAHGRAYATNSVGTAYGVLIAWTDVICLVEGTLVTLADGRRKKIEEIEYSDLLRVWNFDEARFDVAKPLWIKKAEVTNRYNLLKFSDGSSLKTINQHRIFNKEIRAFTYPMTEDTPIGTTTFNVNGQEVTLVSKSVVNEQVNYYNVITQRHINLFADGILTSCRYNNIYPIVDMKFVKDDRMPVAQEQYGVENKYYEGLRLAEQTIPVADTIAYVNRLEALKVNDQVSIFSEVELELSVS